MRVNRSSRARSPRLWLALFILSSASMLMACSPQTAPFKDRPPLPADLTQPCPTLSPLQDATASSILQKIGEVSAAYYDCSARHSALVKAVQP